MKKNLVKRFLSLCMVALVVVMSTTVITDTSYEVAPCEDIKPDPYLSDSPNR